MGCGASATADSASSDAKASLQCIAGTSNVNSQGSNGSRCSNASGAQRGTELKPPLTRKCSRQFRSVVTDADRAPSLPHGSLSGGLPRPLLEFPHPQRGNGGYYSASHSTATSASAHSNVSRNLDGTTRSSNVLGGAHAEFWAAQQQQHQQQRHAQRDLRSVSGEVAPPLVDGGGGEDPLNGDPDFDCAWAESTSDDDDINCGDNGATDCEPKANGCTNVATLPLPIVSSQPGTASNPLSCAMSLSPGGSSGSPQPHTTTTTTTSNAATSPSLVRSFDHSPPPMRADALSPSDPSPGASTPPEVVATTVSPPTKSSYIEHSDSIASLESVSLRPLSSPFAA